MNALLGLYASHRLRRWSRLASSNISYKLRNLFEIQDDNFLLIRKEKKTTVNKIVFIQPGYAHYRRPLFDRLSERYDILFVFLGRQYTYPSFDKGSKSWDTMCLHSEEDLFWPLKLLRILFCTEANVIISSVPTSVGSLVSYLACRLKGKKFIIWTLSWNLSYEYLHRPEIYRRLRHTQYRFIVKKANAVVVSGNHSYNNHIEFGVPIARLFVANQTSFDLSVRKSTDISVLPLATQKKHTILYFSRIMLRKGLDILIKAFKNLESEIEGVRLLIAGDGDFRPFCENLVQELHVRDITFLGGIPFEKAASYYAISDVFVLPSCLRGQSEAWGLVINEAMSMGKPIITTDAVGAAYDLVENGVNGYVVKSGDVDDLYGALKRVLCDDELMKTMGRNSRKKFEQFNGYEKMFEGFENAIAYVERDSD